MDQWYRSFLAGAYRTDCDQQQRNGRAAQFTPGLTGHYTVQVWWAVHPTEANPATIKVNGSTVATVNEQDFASPNAASSNLKPAAPTGSGWYTLPGSYDLNGASTIEFSDTNNGANGVGNLDVNELRFTQAKDVILSPSQWLRQIPTGVRLITPHKRTSRPRVDVNGSGVNRDRKCPDVFLTSSGLTGATDVYVSWDVGPASLNNHTTALKYLIDLDGNLQTTGDQSFIQVNQNLFADQSYQWDEQRSMVWLGLHGQLCPDLPEQNRHTTMGRLDLHGFRQYSTCADRIRARAGFADDFRGGGALRSLSNGRVVSPQRIHVGKMRPPQRVKEQ